MRAKKIKTFRFRRRGNPVVTGMSPRRPAITPPEQEALFGEVQGVKASAPEERMAKALNKANLQYIFRHTVGAPRGLPGWKELDFLVTHNGMLYAVEVDTAFTHRDKAYKDVLHDAIVLSDPELNSMGNLWPQVMHVDGDSDLANQENAERYVKNFFGR